MIETVKYGDALWAIIIRSDFKADGIQFFTKDSDTLQLGYMNRARRYLISPHIHRPVPRSVEYTHEVLFIRAGKVKVNFYDDDCVYRQSIILNQSDVILLMTGGHGFEMLEDSR